jgi:alginate O-acetyltransferase complex protein AlgI
MVFNSTVFLYLFLPITWLIFRALRTKEQRYICMAAAGYVFYSFWNYKFCALMLLSTLVSYTAGLGFLKWEDPRRRRLCLILPVVFDLGLLAVFKYTNFALSNVNELLAQFHGQPLPLLDVVLPVGISFYTFHTITYIVDSYRRVIVPTRNFFEFACYVSLFPQLVAGPIVRFRQIEKDLDEIDHPSRAQWIETGWSFLVLGMIKKVLIADSIAAIVNPALANFEALSTVGAWMCALGYTYQLYFDFSGYSDMAVGLGYLFGLRLPQNFDSPYRASDIADFWRRWHISLSSVLRDYLYIPLGGSRHGSAKIYRNLLITMLLGGLWHGASWTYVLWGGYHGALLCVNRMAAGAIETVPVVVRRGITFLLVLAGWVLFRASSFHMAEVWFVRMFSWQAGPTSTGAGTLLVLLLIAAGLSHFGRNTWEIEHRWSSAQALGLASLFVLCLIVIQGGNQSQFLYFQF